MMRHIRYLIAILFIACGPAFAVLPDEVLDDPALEARAREISAELRCLVCQNQSIDDSDADLARDLRLLVRERLVEGDSNAQVFDYVVARYGEFVLLKPTVSAQNLVLWITTPMVLLLGLIGLLLFARSRSTALSQATESANSDVQGANLSEDEKRVLAELSERETDA